MKDTSTSQLPQNCLCSSTVSLPPENACLLTCASTEASQSAALPLDTGQGLWGSSHTSDSWRRAGRLESRSLKTSTDWAKNWGRSQTLFRVSGQQKG